VRGCAFAVERFVHWHPDDEWPRNGQVEVWEGTMPLTASDEGVDAINESGRKGEANTFLAHCFIPRKEGEAPLQPNR
jgi:hypothetical protein